MNIVILGLSITSSWGNGHATTYRGLVRELTRQGHHVLFLERDMPWYAAQRDLPDPPFGKTRLYDSVATLKRACADAVRAADAVIVGSYVPDGAAVAEWALDEASGCVAFYDIDTPVTLAKLDAGDHEYLAPELVPRFDLYLSFTGVPVLGRLEN
jgi:spore maturation protein CgeB